MHRTKLQEYMYGFPAEDLARRLKVCPRTLSYWRTGERMPPMRALIKIAALSDGFLTWDDIETHVKKFSK